MKPICSQNDSLRLSQNSKIGAKSVTVPLQDHNLGVLSQISRD